MSNIDSTFGRIYVEIRNIGSKPATSVDCSIEMRSLIGPHRTETIHYNILEADSAKVFQSKLIFGIGVLYVKVSVSALNAAEVSAQHNFFMFGFLIIY